MTRALYINTLDRALGLAKYTSNKKQVPRGIGKNKEAKLPIPSSCSWVTQSYQYTNKESQWISVRCSVYVGYQPLVYVEIFQFKNIIKRDCFDLATKGKCSIVVL